MDISIARGYSSKPCQVLSSIPIGCFAISRSNLVIKNLPTPLRENFYEKTEKRNLSRDSFYDVLNQSFERNLVSICSRFKSCINRSTTGQQPGNRSVPLRITTKAIGDFCCVPKYYLGRKITRRASCARLYFRAWKKNIRSREKYDQKQLACLG